MFEFIVSLIILFNISCLLHYRATIHVYKHFNIINDNKNQIKPIEIIIKVGFITTIAFFILLELSYILYEISDTYNISIKIIDYFLLTVCILGLVNTLRLFLNLNKTFLHDSIFFLTVNIVLFPFGFFEYALSRYFKEFKVSSSQQLPNEKEIKKCLIQKFNSYNLYISIMLVIVLFISLLTIVEKTSIHKLNYILIISLMILIRACGRSIEIIYAFYKDAVKTNIKTSNLSNPDRLQLAIKSFFELLVIFTGVYCILGQQFLINYMFDYRDYFQTFNPRYFPIALVDSFKNGTIVGADFILSKDSLQLPTNIFIRECGIAFFVSLHSLTNLVLTLFSIARYSVNEKET